MANDLCAIQGGYSSVHRWSTRRTGGYLAVPLISSNRSPYKILMVIINHPYLRETSLPFKRVPPRSVVVVVVVAVVVWSIV